MYLEEALIRKATIKTSLTEEDIKSSTLLPILCEKYGIKKRVTNSWRIKRFRIFKYV